MVSTSHRQPKTENSATTSIVTLRGTQGADVALPSEFADITVQDGRQVLLDFSNVEHVSSEDLGALISLRKRVLASNGRLTLFNLHADVYEVLRVTNLHKALDVCH